MKGKEIGAFRNEWRRRFVRIFEDTTDPSMVYTEGAAFNTGTVTATHEPRGTYATWIGRFNGVYE